MIDQRTEFLYEFEANTRETLCQGDHFHEHDEAHDIVVEILAHANSVRTHEVFLEMHEFIVADTDRRQLSKSRIDAVHLVAVSDDVVDQLIGLGNTPSGAVTQLHGHMVKPGAA
jgi:hypothetical protein